MKILQHPDTDKINFVDENNVFVGYDMAVQCCEFANWFISDTVQTDIEAYTEGKIYDWPGWTFDISFQPIESDIPDCYNCGYTVIFRLVNEDKEKFLHLFNVHNGYYSHGFEFTKGGEVLKEGYL